MCGRYYIEIDERELKGICDSITTERQGREEQRREEQLEIKLRGEVFPTDIVPVRIGAGEYQAMKWGFAGFDGKPIINARSETASIKPMFRESMKTRRCLIPASGYFEWKREGNKKVKHRIYIPERTIFMAGCFRQEKGAPLNHFVILTRAAANGLESIHERMPVIIPQRHAEKWLRESLDVMSEAELDLGLVIECDEFRIEA